MKANLRYLWALLKINMKAAMAARAAYLIRSGFAIVTHLIYILVWFLFFHAVPDIGGWRLEHILLAYGLAIVAWGVISFLAYGFRTLPDQVDFGELDTFLTQPRPVLLNVAMGSSKASGPGETVFGIGLMILAGLKTEISIPALLAVMVCSVLVFGALILACASLGFWLRNFRSTGEELYYNFNILASRPGPIFTGWLKVVALTVIPVSFMTHMPLEFLLENKWQAMAMTVAGTLACMAVSVLVFNTGLKYYESGNRFGVRG